jgi:hypothetical protein
LAVAGAFALRLRMQRAPIAPAKGPSSLAAWAALANAIRPASLTQGRAGRRLKLVESTRVSHQVEVCLFECDGRSFIIAATAQGAFVVKPEDGAEIASS